MLLLYMMLYLTGSQRTPLFGEQCDVHQCAAEDPHIPLISATLKYATQKYGEIHRPIKEDKTWLTFSVRLSMPVAATAMKIEPVAAGSRGS